MYARATDHSEEEVEEFYSQIRDLIKKIPYQELHLLIDYFNANVSNESKDKHIGPHELGVRNQIDYILVNQRYRNSFQSVKTYPAANIQSDHNPLVGEYRMKFSVV